MFDVQAAEADLRRLERQIDRDVGEARAAAQRGMQLQLEVQQLRAAVESYVRAGEVLQRYGDERQETARGQVEALVTHGLHTIFGEDLSFHLVSGVRGKLPVLDFVVRTTNADGSTVDTPVLDARGGGVAAVVGFLVRVVVLLLTPQRQAPVLFLDESFAQLSEDYEGRLAEFLRELCDRSPLQVVLVTHSHAYSDVADYVYRFALEDGVTKVVEAS